MLPPAARSDACEAWTALESRIASTGLTCSWDWTETWLDVYGADLPHSFVLGERDGRPCGLALVVRGTGRSGAIPIRRLHVGTAGARAGEGINVEYNRLLVEPDSRAAFSAALLDTLVHAPEWDELVLDGFARGGRAVARGPPGLKPSARPRPIDLRAAAERAGGARSAQAAPSGGASQHSRLRRLETEWAATLERARDPRRADRVASGALAGGRRAGRVRHERFRRSTAR